MRIDPEEHLAVMPGGLGPDDDPGQAPGRLAGAACGVADIIGREPGFDEFAAALCEGMTEALGIRLEADQLTPDEAERADELRATKYATDGWTIHRRGAEAAADE